MEQQTISLAKGGIHATLNARTSILAAVNPIMGRYDRSKSLGFNVDISPQIMSRFDLFFVIFDERNDAEDFNIAQHLVALHCHNDASLILPEFSTSDLQMYIKFCRLLKPQFTREAAEILKEEYKRIRAVDRGLSKNAYKITVRALESLIRLSEAMARLHCDNIIRADYVKEVCRLTRQALLTSRCLGHVNTHGGTV